MRSRPTTFPSAFRLALAVTALVLGSGGAGQARPEADGGAPGVRFDTREIKTTAEPGDNVVELAYEFTNTGELPLIVEKFIHSCNCMQGGWDGVAVAPGARGKITARLLTMGLRGTVRKALWVKFVEGGTIELAGEVTIPEALAYSARTLRWALNEEALPKHVDIVINSKLPLRILSVSDNDPSFSSRLETVKDGRAYKITVTPLDTTTARVCVMRVRTDSKDARDASQGLFALVGVTGRFDIGPVSQIGVVGFREDFHALIGDRGRVCRTGLCAATGADPVHGALPRTPGFSEA